MIDLLRQYTPGFLERHGNQAPPQVQNVLAKLAMCRTLALGEHVYECPQCQHRSHVYNSCLDRHCPLCSGGRRADWLDKTAQLLLPKVDYFQIVFTVPEPLWGLMLGNRRATYRLLFQAAWAALGELLREAVGCEPAALMVLHTWNQRLEHYPHLHALVPGGGPSLDGQRWIQSKHPYHHGRHKPYLVDNTVLSDRFRAKFLAGLAQLHDRSELKLEDSWSDLQDPAAFVAWLNELDACDWVVYIEPPETEDAQPEHVLKYLARYLTGGPISDRRLIAHQDDKVTFWARSRDKGGGNPSRALHVDGRRVHPPLGVAHSAQGVRQVPLLWRLQLPAAESVSHPLPHAGRQPAGPRSAAVAGSVCERAREGGTIHAPLPAVSDSDAVCFPGRACQLEVGRQRPPRSRVVRPPPSRPHLGVSRRGPRASGRIAHDRLPPHRRVASSRGPRQTPARLPVWSHVEKPAFFGRQSTRRRPLPPRSARSSPVAVSIPGLLN